VTDPSRRGRVVEGGLVAYVIASSLLGLFVFPDLGGLGIAHAPGPYREPDLVVAVLAVTQCLPVLWRRQYPYAVLTVVGASYVLDDVAAAPPMIVNAGVLVAVHAASSAHGAGVLAPRPLRALTTRWAGLRASTQRAVGASALVGAVLAVGLDGVMYASFFVVIWLFGSTSAVRMRQVTYLREERRGLAAQAATRERLRLAVEMHDVVSHTLSLVTVQAGIARRTLENRPGTARRALAAIEDSTRSGAEQVRGILRLMRRPGSGEVNHTAPTLDDLPILYSRLRDAGLGIDERIEGNARPLPVEVSLSAYRIVQEALTNVLKHSGGSMCAWISITYEPEILDVQVRNSGFVPARDGEDAGYGLRGLQERVTTIGGHFHAGPRADGDFVVRARLPLNESTMGRRTT